MDLNQPLHGDPPEPEQEGHPGGGLVVGQPFQRVDIGLLQDVRGCHPALEPAVQPELDHPAQAVAIVGEQVTERELVARLEPVDQGPDVVGIIHHRVLGSAPGRFDPPLGETAGWGSRRRGSFGYIIVLDRSSWKGGGPQAGPTAMWRRLFPSPGCLGASIAPVPDTS
jgi:hypothetical protein